MDQGFLRAAQIGFHLLAGLDLASQIGRAGDDHGLQLFRLRQSQSNDLTALLNPFCNRCYGQRGKRCQPGPPQCHQP